MVFVRFRGEADMHERMAWPALVAPDPSATSATKFAVMHNAALFLRCGNVRSSKPMRRRS